MFRVTEPPYMENHRRCNLCHCLARRADRVQRAQYTSLWIAPMNYYRAGGGLRAFLPATPRDFTTRNSADAISPRHCRAIPYVRVSCFRQANSCPILPFRSRSEREGERKREVTQVDTIYRDSKRSFYFIPLLFHSFRGDTSTRYLACQSL